MPWKRKPIRQPRPCVMRLVVIMFRSIGNLHGKAKKLLQNKLKHIVACSFKIVFATRPGCFDGPSQVTVLLIDGRGKHCLRLDFEVHSSRSFLIVTYHISYLVRALWLVNFAGPYSSVQQGYFKYLTNLVFSVCTVSYESSIRILQYRTWTRLERGIYLVVFKSCYKKFYAQFVI